MPRQSTVKRLPPEIREVIGALLDQGRTLDEILTKLRELGVDNVSRSALGRYSKDLAKVSERIRRGREVAEALVRKLGDAPESKITRMNVELVHSVITDLTMAALEAEGEDAEGGDAKATKLTTLNPMGAMLLAKGLDHLAKASKADADLVNKLRERARKEAEAKVDEAVAEAGEVAKRDKLSPQEVLALLKKIYRGEA